MEKVGVVDGCNGDTDPDSAFDVGEDLITEDLSFVDLSFLWGELFFHKPDFLLVTHSYCGVHCAV
jgi:hypothetical protein